MIDSGAPDFQDAVNLNNHSLAEALHLGDPEVIHNAQINLGENYLAMDNLSEAKDMLERAWREIKKSGISYTRWRYKTRVNFTADWGTLKKGLLSFARP